MMDELELYAVYDGTSFDSNLGVNCILFQFKKSSTSNYSYGSGCFWVKYGTKSQVCGEFTIDQKDYYVDNLEVFCNRLRNLLDHPILLVDDELEDFCLHIVNIENLYYKVRGFLRSKKCLR